MSSRTPSSRARSGPGRGAYAFAIFAITWAWLNFTWFASAYGNDDALFRVATVVQMVGVVILTFGLPVSFQNAADGESPNNRLLVVGYLIMRVPLVVLWLRAAREDPGNRRTSIAYAVVIAIAQVGWALTTLPGLSSEATVTFIVVLAAAETDRARPSSSAASGAPRGTPRTSPSGSACSRSSRWARSSPRRWPPSACS